LIRVLLTIDFFDLSGLYNKMLDCWFTMVYFKIS
jgi:hypothetical protein